MLLKSEWNKKRWKLLSIIMVAACGGGVGSSLGLTVFENPIYLIFTMIIIIVLMGNYYAWMKKAWGI